MPRRSSQTLARVQVLQPRFSYSTTGWLFTSALVPWTDSRRGRFGAGRRAHTRRDRPRQLRQRWERLARGRRHVEAIHVMQRLHESNDGARVFAIAAVDQRDLPLEARRARDLDLHENAELQLAFDRDARQDCDPQPLLHHLLGGFEAIELHRVDRYQPRLAKDTVDQAVITGAFVVEDHRL